MSHRIVRGWAWHPQQPKRRVRLEIFYRDIYLGRVSAGMSRPDLEAHGIGDGRHGFMFHLPEDVPTEGFDPMALAVVSAGPQRWTLPFSVELASSGPAACRLPTSYREVLGPFVQLLRDKGPLPTPLATHVGPRARIDKLCADVGDLEVSAFVEHIANKYERSSLISSDANGFWRWYLGTYAAEHGPRLAPLSRLDIERLSRPASGAGSYAAGLLLAPEAPEIAYEWALEADRLWVADCLVGPKQAAVLGAIGATRSGYPLTRFMRLAKAETALLRRLPTATARQRKRLYALFMILGLRNPSILSYMPKEWMLRLLESGLETALGGAELAIDADRYKACVEASGYDLSSRSFQGHRYRDNRVFGGPAVVSAPAAVDVQVFGPFRRKMGLAESCRRVAAALQATRYSVNLVDYDVGTAGGLVEPAHHLQDARPARLNLLHLNAEEIPEALAYLPDFFSQTPTVAMPYWELNRLSRAHRLGVQAVDEIWVASRFLADVFSEGARGVRWVGMCCTDAPKPTAREQAALRTRLGFASDTFLFLTISDAMSWVQRKNPLAVIEAFRSAFETENVALVVKTHNLAGPLSQAQVENWDRVRELCAVDQRIVLVDQSFDAPTQRALLAACDCLVSLHRAEGLGLDVVDALDLGTSVIATDYSGTRDLCNRDTAWLVDFDMRAVSATDYTFVEPRHLWAEPRLESAIRVMRELVANPAERDIRLRKGQSLISATATTERFAERIERAVDATIGGC